MAEFYDRPSRLVKARSTNHNPITKPATKTSTKTNTENGRKKATGKRMGGRENGVSTITHRDGRPKTYEKITPQKPPIVTGKRGKPRNYADVIVLLEKSSILLLVRTRVT